MYPLNSPNEATILEAVLFKVDAKPGDL